MIGTFIVEGGGELTPIHWKILSSALQSGRKGDGLSWSRPDVLRMVVSVGGSTGPVFERYVNTVVGGWIDGKAGEKRLCWMLAENL